MFPLIAFMFPIKFKYIKQYFRSHYSLRELICRCKYEIRQRSNRIKDNLDNLDPILKHNEEDQVRILKEEMKVLEDWIYDFMYKYFYGTSMEDIFLNEDFDVDEVEEGLFEINGELYHLPVEQENIDLINDTLEPEEGYSASKYYNCFHNDIDED